ncbi:hypothetical protein [Sphingosinicella rhizophila]|uniref:Uncharacterized protein n=1 Tax=Sphingosinicella rhizophila TaxID=3050082 RepID=A0ABU3Q6N9_9SPHN|nr:hypothetical protein [Sphingosinicella sp. GR2756]MDT9599064.1 hypothetical protein [Sphingosinicella sp. GR2756]
MSYQSAPSSAPDHGDPGEQVAQLRHVLTLVEEIAGRTVNAPKDADLDEAARISALYASALPIVQRRFDAFAAETAIWASAGVKALLALQDRNRAPEPAAARLADALAKALKRLVTIIRA